MGFLKADISTAFGQRLPCQRLTEACVVIDSIRGWHAVVTYRCRFHVIALWKQRVPMMCVAFSERPRVERRHRDVLRIERNDVIDIAGVFRRKCRQSTGAGDGCRFLPPPERGQGLGCCSWVHLSVEGWVWIRASAQPGSGGASTAKRFAVLLRRMTTRIRDCVSISSRSADRSGVLCRALARCRCLRWCRYPRWCRCRR